MSSKMKRIIIIFIIIIAILVCSLSTYAIYAKDSIYNYYLESKGFYLTSDSLGNDLLNTNTLWDGNSIHLSVNNYTSNNNITDYDIRYTLSCELLDNVTGTCTFNGTNNSSLNLTLSHNESCFNNLDQVDVSNLNKTDCELGGYTWVNNKVNQDVYFNLNIDNSITDVRVKITLRATSPYQKILTGIYRLHKAELNTGSLTKSINPNNLYNDLIITNSYNTDKCVRVTFDSSKRVLDDHINIASSLSDSNNYINDFKVLVPGLSNKKISLYNKQNILNDDYNDIDIEESTGCV